MNKFLLLISMLLFAGCSPDVVYIDSSSGQPVEPVVYMEHITHRQIVCIDNRQYYTFYDDGKQFLLRHDDFGSTIHCDNKTLADGTHEK